MELVNHLSQYLNSVPQEEWNRKLLREIVEKLTLALSPFAPHLAEEFWHDLGNDSLVVQQAWPSYDPKALEVEEVEIAIQINGKVRDKVVVPVDISEEALKRIVLERERVKEYVDGKPIRKFIYVKGRIVNIVV